MPIGERLKEARLNKGITQKDLAAAVGVSQGAIGNYEANIASPKETILLRLMSVLEVDANFLYQDFIKKNPRREMLSPEEYRLITAWRNAESTARTIAIETLENHPLVQEGSKQA